MNKLSIFLKRASIYGGVLLLGGAIATPAFAQAVEDDVVINEFVVNPTTGREYTELLVVKTGGVDMRGFTLSDVGTRAGATGATEGDLTLSATATFLSNVPQGTHVVLVYTTPTTNANTLTEDTDSSDKKLVLNVGGGNLTTAGTIDNATSDNLQLYAGSRAAGTLIDQVLAGTNTSYIAGATFGDNNGTTTADNIDGDPVAAGANAIPANAAVRFVPAADSIVEFMNNDTGSKFVVDANSFGTPGAANTGVTENSLSAAPPASGPVGFAVVGNSLYTFPIANPETATLVGAAGAIGFAPEGIDFNPANGLLYALDVESTPGNTSLYTLSLTTGAATLVGSFASAGMGNGTNGPATNTYSLAGQQIGFDFNPKTLQTDGSIRIRVTAQNGSDIRLNSATGGVAGVDGTLRAGGTLTSIVGSAYTNNFAQIAGGPTTLYDVADANDSLYIQNPPNNGTLVLVGAVGALASANPMAATGFDIFTGTGATANIAYLATNTDSAGGAEFYTVDLTTGVPTAAGTFGTLDVSDIAIQPLAAGASVPFVTSIVRGGASATATVGTPVTFTVTFSEAVTGVDITDFAVTQTGNTTSSTVTGVTGSGTTYTVTVGNFMGNGTFRLDVVDIDDSIIDSTSVPLGGTGTANGNFTAGQTFTVGASDTTGVILSEFRFRGKMGALDEYVELYNKRGGPLNISGWSIQTRTATGLQTSLVPNGKIIPPFGRYLFTGSGFSLSGYGTSDQPIAADILDASGVALFNAAGTAQDAVGFTTSDAALREGAGLPSAPTSDGEYAFVRDTTGTLPKDTADSTNDFVFVIADADATTPTALATVTGTSGNVVGRLGAPSPEGIADPAYANPIISGALLDPNVSQSAAPNRERVGFVPNTSLGDLLIRRTITNNSGRAITKLRFSVASITSLGTPGPAGQADVRLVSSTDENVTIGMTSVPVKGLTLETGATGQPALPLGGGLGSSAVLGEVSMATPLANGASRSVVFRLQILKSGNFSVLFNFHAAPGS